MVPRIIRQSDNFLENELKFAFLLTRVNRTLIQAIIPLQVKGWNLRNCDGLKKIILVDNVRSMTVE